MNTYCNRGVWPGVDFLVCGLGVVLRQAGAHLGGTFE